MDWLESLVLGAVQGVTEFLPVSSDGHLTITAKLFACSPACSARPQENVFFDVMLHLGTLLAILVHYRKQALGRGPRAAGLRRGGRALPTRPA